LTNAGSHTDAPEAALCAPSACKVPLCTARANVSVYCVDPTGQRFLLVAPDEQIIAPITVVLNWPSLLSTK
jgi:hypothetical protein